MVDIIGLLPLTAGAILALAINVIIVTAVLSLSNKLLAHEMSIAHSFMMAVLSYFIVPIFLSLLRISFPFSGYVLPLLVWIALGEVLLKGDRMGKLKAAAAAFVIYVLLMSLGVLGFIAGLVPG